MYSYLHFLCFVFVLCGGRSWLRPSLLCAGGGVTRGHVARVHHHSCRRLRPATCRVGCMTELGSFDDVFVILDPK